MILEIFTPFLALSFWKTYKEGPFRQLYALFGIRLHSVDQKIAPNMPILIWTKTVDGYLWNFTANKKLPSVFTAAACLRWRTDFRPIFGFSY